MKSTSVPTPRLFIQLLHACALLLCSLTWLTASALESIPSFYAEPGLSSQRSTVNQQQHEHIDPFTGKLQWHYTDLVLPGNGGQDIVVQRSYTSLDDLPQEPTALGVGWTMSYGRVLRRGSMLICDSNLAVGNAPVLELPDGSRQILYVVSTATETSWITTNRWRAVCAAPAGIGLHVYSPDGTRYEMNTQGQAVGSGNANQRQVGYYTTRVVDRNGNVLNISYEPVANNLSIKQISSSDGRVVNFTYANNVLSTVSDGVRTWKYEYSDSPLPYYPFLKKVTRPDGQAWQYEYNGDLGVAPGSYSMKKVTYPTGGTYDYLYGHVTFNAQLFRTTVVSQKSGDNSTWQYVYTPAVRQCELRGDYCYFVAGAYDSTDVFGPEGQITFRHIGANSVISGLVFLIGAQLNNLRGEGDIFYEAVKHSYDAQQISRVRNTRPGAAWIIDDATYALIPEAKYINRYGQVYLSEYSNYDAYGNAGRINETGPDGITARGVQSRETNITYSPNTSKWLIRQVAKQSVAGIGNVMWTYDGNGNILRKDKYGVTTDYTYNFSGDIATKKDALGNVVSYGDYFRGLPRLETHPEAVTIKREVTAAGNASAVIDGENRRTEYTYDALNRLASIKHPRGNPVSVSWSPGVREVVRGNYRETITYDGFGRERNIVHADSALGTTVSQTYRWDAANRKVFASYPGQSLGTYTEYLPTGDVRQISHAANDAGAVSEGVTLFGYTANSRFNIDEMGFAHSRTYRAWGEPGSMELTQYEAPRPFANSLQRSASNLTLTRNPMGQVVSVLQDGVTRSYGYDARHFLISSNEPETGTTSLGRDAVGNLVSRKVGSSGLTTFVYDGRNRLTTTVFSDGTPAVTRIYLKDDLLSAITQGDVTRANTYDENKNLQNESVTIGTRTFQIRRTFDQNDTLSALVYGSNNQVAYAPDALGRPTKALPYVSAAAYHPNGALKTMTYVNGVTTSVDLASRQWPARQDIKKANNLILDQTQSYDLAGNVLTADSSDATQRQNFSYDSLFRLTGFSAPGTGQTMNVEYDGRGNYTRAFTSSSGWRRFAYTGEKLSSVTPEVGGIPLLFTHDLYGNVSSNGKNSFQYNEAQQLVCSDCGLPTQRLYGYDGAGMRARTFKDGKTTFSIYTSGGQLLWEEAEGDALTEYYYLSGKQIATRRLPLK